MQQSKWALLEALPTPPTTSFDTSFIFIFEETALLQKCMHMATSRQRMNKHLQIFQTLKISPLRSAFWKLGKPGNLLHYLKNWDNEGTNCLPLTISCKISSVPGQHCFTCCTENFQNTLQQIHHKTAEENCLAYTINSEDLHTMGQFWIQQHYRGIMFVHHIQPTIDF